MKRKLHVYIYCSCDGTKWAFVWMNQVFLKEGILMKLSRKVMQPRMFFLVSGHVCCCWTQGRGNCLGKGDLCSGQISLAHSNSSFSGIFDCLECLFACQFPECFSHFSPCHSDAFVSLLPGNKQRGRDRSGSALCPGTSFGWVLAQWGGSQPAPSPEPLRSSAALQRWEVCSVYWGSVWAGTWPWEHSCPGSQALHKWLWWESNDLYLPRASHLPL